jgi:hypothetical protein
MIFQTQNKSNLNLPFDLFGYHTRGTSFRLELHRECAKLERLPDEDFGSFQSVHSLCSE